MYRKLLAILAPFMRLLHGVPYYNGLRWILALYTDRRVVLTAILTSTKPVSELVDALATFNKLMEKHGRSNEFRA